MAITLSYTYPDGTALDAASHNHNVFNKTVATAGVMSGSNGFLDSSNLDASFSFSKDLVQPNGVVRTFSSHFVGMQDVNNLAVENEFAGIGGCGLRFYIPFSAELVLYHWTVMVAPWRPKWDISDGASPPSYNTGNIDDIILSTWFDGSKDSTTNRKMPLSALIVDAAANVGTIAGRSRDGLCAVPISQHRADTNVSAGWHDVQVKVYLPQTPKELDMNYPQFPASPSPADKAADIRCRVTIGISRFDAIVFAAHT